MSVQWHVRRLCAVSSPRRRVGVVWGQCVALGTER